MQEDYSNDDSVNDDEIQMRLENQNNDLKELSPITDGGVQTGRGPLYSSYFEDGDGQNISQKKSTKKGNNNVSAQRYSYISDKTPTTSEKKSQISNQLSQIKKKVDFMSPISQLEDGQQKEPGQELIMGEDNLKSLTMEKIENLKEISREIFRGTNEIPNFRTIKTTNTTENEDELNLYESYIQGSNKKLQLGNIQPNSSAQKRYSRNQFQDQERVQQQYDNLESEEEEELCEDNLLGSSAAKNFSTFTGTAQTLFKSMHSEPPEGVNVPNPFLHTKNSEAYYSFKTISEAASTMKSDQLVSGGGSGNINKDGFQINQGEQNKNFQLLVGNSNMGERQGVYGGENTNNNNNNTIANNSSNNKPPLTKFTFDQAHKEQFQSPDPNNMALKLNSSFTLGRHPKLQDPPSLELSFQREASSMKKSRSSSVRSSPDRVQGRNSQSQSLVHHYHNEQQQQYQQQDQSYRRSFSQQQQQIYQQGATTASQKRQQAPVVSSTINESNFLKISPQSCKISSRTKSPPSYLRELTDEMTPERVMLNKQFSNEDSIRKAQGSLEQKVEDLIQKNAVLKQQVTKYQKALNKYKDSAATIKEQQNQISRLQSQLLKNEIDYQTKINILQQNNEKFVPNSVNPEIGKLNLILSEKENKIAELNNLVDKLKANQINSSNNQQLLGQSLSRNSIIQEQQQQQQQQQVYQIDNNNINKEEYIEKLQAEIKQLQHQLMTQNKTTGIIENQQNSIGVQSQFSHFLGVFLSKNGKIFLEIYSSIRQIKINLYNKKKETIIQIIEDIIDMIERNFGEEIIDNGGGQSKTNNNNNNNQHSTSRFQSMPFSSEYFDGLVENGLTLISYVNDLDWNQAHQIIIALEDDLIREFRKIEQTTSINISEWNAPISEESIFQVSKTQNTITDRNRTNRNKFTSPRFNTLQSNTISANQQSSSNNNNNNSQNNNNLSQRVSAVSQRLNSNSGHILIGSQSQNNEIKGMISVASDRDDDEEQQYMSDYSDEDFDVEDLEENMAIDLISKIKEQIEDRSITERDFKRMWQGYFDEDLTDFEFVEAFKVYAFLVRLSVDSNYQEFCSLVIRIDQLKFQDGTIDWKTLFSNLKNKNLTWWKNKIKNQSFDFKYKNWNLKLLAKEENCFRQLVFESILYKLSKYFKIFDQSQKIEEIKNDINLSFLTKKIIRQLFLDHKIPFNKFETQLITFLLDSKNTNKIDPNTFLEFLETGQLNPIYTRALLEKKQNNLFHSRLSRKNNTHSLKASPEVLLQEQQYSIASEIINEIRSQILGLGPQYESRVKDIFRLKDTRFNGFFNYQQFQDCFIESGLPFESTADIQVIFDYFNSQSRQKLHKQIQEIEYQLFLESIFSKVHKRQDEVQSEEATTTETTKIWEERDLKYQLLMMETQLKDAYSKISDLEGKLENATAVDKSKTKEEFTYNTEDKENSSFLVNLSSQSIANNNNNNMSISQRDFKIIQKRNQLFSNERTLKLKVEDLEFENAKLRNQLDNAKQQLSSFEQENIQYQQTIRTFEKSSKQQKLKEQSPAHLEFIEKKIDSMEKGYIMREIDIKNELVTLRRQKGEESQIAERKFQAEKDELKKIINDKNKEINTFRVELEGILQEVETLRKSKQVQIR